MERGIVKLWCSKCRKVTRHKTVNRNHPALTPHGRRIQRARLLNVSGRQRRLRVCLECGKRVDF